MVWGFRCQQESLIEERTMENSENALTKEDIENIVRLGEKAKGIFSKQIEKRSRKKMFKKKEKKEKQKNPKTEKPPAKTGG